ncbi:MAG: STAS domain-containing protein [Rhizobacter sp.]|nr:STAS domain-containing protein [Chlorobiales bacterium]
MYLKESERNNVIILELRGDLLGGDDVSEFKTKVKSLADGGKKNLVLDLSKVTYINSSGIGMLVAGMTTVTQAGGKLKMAGLEKNIKNIFTITNLVKVFEVFDTTDAAAASF